MSLISTLTPILIDELKKAIEKEVVNIMKEIIRPYLTVVQVSQMNIKAIGVPADNTNVSAETKSAIESGSYQVGSKLTHPIDTELDESKITNTSLSKSIVPKEPTYGVEETFYIIHNRVTMSYAISVVEEQITTGGEMSLDDVKTYEDLGKFLKGLCESVAADINESVDNAVSGTKKAVSKLPSAGLDCLIDFGNNFVDCGNGIVGAATNVYEAAALNVKFVATIGTTIIDIVTEATALASNPFTVSAAPGYVKKEITQLLSEVTKMQEEGDKIALEFVDHLAMITKPLDPLKTIVTTLNSPTGGIVLALLFKDNTEKITKILSTVDSFMTIITSTQDRLGSLVSDSLSVIGCSVNYTNASGEVINITGNADNSDFTAKVEEGMEQSKVALDNYERDYWGPARDLMKNYNESKASAVNDTENTHVRYDESTYGKGEEIKSMIHIDSLELVRLNESKTLTGSVATKDVFIKNMEGAIKGLQVYHDDYESTYNQMKEDYDKLQTEVNNFKSGGSSGTGPTLEKE